MDGGAGKESFTTEIGSNRLADSLMARDKEAKKIVDEQIMRC